MVSPIFWCGESKIFAKEPEDAVQDCRQEALADAPDDQEEDKILQKIPHLDPKAVGERNVL